MKVDVADPELVHKFLLRDDEASHRWLDPTPEAFHMVAHNLRGKKNWPDGRIVVELAHVWERKARSGGGFSALKDPLTAGLRFALIDAFRTSASPLNLQGRYAGRPSVKSLENNRAFPAAYLALFDELPTVAEADRRIADAVKDDATGLSLETLAKFMCMLDPFSYPAITQKEIALYERILGLPIEMNRPADYFKFLKGLRAVSARYGSWLGETISFPMMEVILDNFGTEALVRAGITLAIRPDESDAKAQRGRKLWSPPTRDSGDEVHAAAMDLARWYYGERKKWTVKTMHHFQPGYDLEVLDSKGLKHYVEVKGCRNNAPTFHISDTQRAFARKFATDGTYRLFLVCNALSPNHYQIKEYKDLTSFKLTATGFDAGLK
ncbi:DUF3883 domain-containing protein [bacterium]|nr:DUF3883 domain-containing protein [bacterium]MCB9480031.1 DUF3883 domain-containing protein [Deltaproteobacteria bacterium]